MQMIVVHSNGSGFTNMANVIDVELEGRYINAHVTTGETICLGAYGTAHRAKEEFGRLVDRISTLTAHRLAVQ